MATSRRLPSDTGAFADWVANSSSSSSVIRPADQDLSLGFNAGPTPTAAVAAAGGGGMWPPSSRQVNYGLPTEMGMFVVAPASSFHHNSNTHHHHHHHHEQPINLPDPHSITSSNVAAATALGVGVGVGVIPLLTSAPCMGVEEDMLNGINRGGRSSNIQFWQHQQQQQPTNYMKKPLTIDHGFGSCGGGGVGLVGVGGSSSNLASNMTCQDCGNQAKKDCSHRRCRTCCKSRGFDCATHVKSTWVPAARRRERQLMTATGATATVAAAGSSASTSGAKKPRLTSQTTTTSHTSTSNTTPPRSFDTSSSHQDVGFKEALPGQVRAPAVFKCVRVTAVDDGDDEYAYQAVVKIGGHVFKGFLYDQGVVEARDAFPNISELHLGGGGGGGGASASGGRNLASSSSPMLDPSDVYAASGGGLLGGSNYGNSIN